MTAMPLPDKPDDESSASAAAVVVVAVVASPPSPTCRPVPEHARPAAAAPPEPRPGHTPMRARVLWLTGGGSMTGEAAAAAQSGVAPAWTVIMIK